MTKRRLIFYLFHAVQLTCAQVGKGSRLVEALKAQRDTKPVTHVWPGFADILLPGMTIGMTGVIAGTGNLFPHLLVELYQTAQQAFEKKDFALLNKAQALQSVVTQADWALAKAGIAGSKWAVSQFQYDVGLPRRPLQPYGKEAQANLVKDLAEPLKREKELALAKGDQYVPKI